MRDESPGVSSDVWFCAKMIFSWYRNATGERICYEERFLLLLATDPDQAILKAEQEGETYCREFGPDWSAKYEFFCRVYELSDCVLQDLTEVFSETHKSPLDPLEYIERYHLDEGLTGWKKTPSVSSDENFGETEKQR